MTDDVKTWLKDEGKFFLKNIGIKEGQVVLDFGCGVGHYTIPAAKAVGKKGRVYAVDKDAGSLRKLKQIAESEGLKNIVAVKTSSSLKINLDDETIDVVLLYDVLHSYYFKPKGRTKILGEVYRISKPTALISIFPKHMELEEIIGEVETSGFSLEKKVFKKLIHDDNYDEGYILNFRKGATQ